MAKLRRRARHRTANGSLDLFLRTRGSSEPAAKIAVGAKTTRTVTNDRARWPTLDHPAKAMMYLDTVSYLPDEMRVKVDRASMGVGLEISSPLLDQQVSSLQSLYHCSCEWTGILTVRGSCARSSIATSARN